MNAGTLLSFAASIMLFSITGLFMAVAGAPGWQRARLYLVIALTGALYSAVDILFSVSGAALDTLRLVGTLNYLFACIHTSAWVVLAYSPARPWRSLPSVLRWLVVVTVALGAIAAVPGVATSASFHDVSVPWLGVTYRQNVTTWFGDLLSAWILAVLTIPFVRFLEDQRRGIPYASNRVIGFAFFFACCVVEVLVSTGKLQFFYLADLGFLAIVLSLLIETFQRVIRDARALELLRRDLESQVSHRTVERDEARSALVIAERHAALGQLAAGVGHEINNPLTYIKANLEFLSDELGRGKLPNETQELLDEALIGTSLIQRVVSDLRAYALPVGEKTGYIDLLDVLETTLKLALREFPSTTTVVRHLDPVGRVKGDPMRLRQVLLNLLINAGIATREAGRTSATLTLRTFMSGAAELTLEVTDTGVGMSPAAVARLGEPYFSSRLDRGGTGLGIFVSRGIVESLGGSLYFESEVGVGTTARLTLPARMVEPDQETLPAYQLPQHSPAALLMSKRVLVVDDDPAVARAVARQLGGAEIALSGDDALTRILEGPELDLVLCDVMMPGKSGQDVYRTLAEKRPDLLPRLAFMTGGTTIPEVAEFLRSKGIKHIAKPLQREGIRKLLEEMQVS